MFGIALIAVLAITGGMIAYIGDKLGTKVGKKKLTIFGLRPKHTSIVVTIITGILITISTIGILTLVSRDVRTALFGMEALKNELSTLSQEVTTQNGELDRSRNALAAKNLEYATLTNKVQETTNQLAAIASELSAVMAQRDQSALQLEQTERDYAVARGEINAAQQSINRLQNTKNELDMRVKDLTEAKSNLQLDINNLTELTSKLKQGLQVVREGSIIYRAGEILTTTVLPGSENHNDTVKALSDIIYNTNQTIIDKLDIKDKNLEILWIAQSDFDKVISEVTTTHQDVIVRISAGGNTVYGEPVIGNISIFPNHYIYRPGQTVHMEIVDMGRNAMSPEESVMLFLQKVNVAAIKQGILPDPLQGTVGAISGTEFYDAVNTLKRYNGKVTLVATAKNETYTAGPLKIEIHIQGSP
ncbi:DUF3084 domain-containing protein [Pelosinus sp. sgz500959]|uniref:DUF3084 domain-containing protein n=1 Tax=Pelosinus sp. sgz500959 TaxID=3242472 RepID=UPI003671FC75